MKGCFSKKNGIIYLFLLIIKKTLYRQLFGLAGVFFILETLTTPLQLAFCGLPLCFSMTSAVMHSVSDCIPYRRIFFAPAAGSSKGIKSKIVSLAGGSVRLVYSFTVALTVL